VSADSRLRERRHELAFGAALALASAATVDKYAGHAATAVYVLLLLALTPAVVDLLAAVRTRISERQALWLALATLAALALLFAVVYPHADAGVPGSGSDRDDAADIAAAALRHGHYPYAAVTYLGNPVSQFPGGVLFAVPFEAIGPSALAAFVWLPLLFAILRSLAGEARSPLLLLWTALVLSPVLVREVVTGGDLIANTACVMIAAWIVVEGAERTARWTAWLGAVVLGVGLSWRLSFLFVLPPLLALVWRRQGARAAAVAAALSAGAFAAVTLPFSLGHRGEFTPLGASNKLEGFDGAIPGGARTVLLVGLLLSVTLPLAFAPSTLRAVFGQTAVVEAFFLLAVVVLASAQARTLELEPLVPGYGVPVVLLALGALARPLPLRARARQPRHVPATSS
jgi:hypothetical protein